LHLGNAYLRSGEVYEALRAIGNSASLAVRNRQSRLMKELRATRARMQPWRDTQAVKELDEHLVGMGFGG